MKNFSAYITHSNGNWGMHFSSTTESASRVDFAPSLTLRADMTYLTYDKQSRLESESSSGKYSQHTSLSD